MGITGLLFASLFSAFATADVKIIDSRGKVQSAPWATKSVWVWRDNDNPQNYPDAPPQVPVRMVWVNMRNKSEPVVPDPSLGKVSDDQGESPFKDGYSVGFEGKGEAQSKLPWAKVGSDEDNDKAIVPLPDMEAGVVLTHDSCGDYGIALRRDSAYPISAEHVALLCEEATDGVNLYIFHPAEQIVAVRKGTRTLRRTPTWTKVFVSAPTGRNAWREPKDLTKFELVLRENRKEKQGRAVVRLDPAPEDRRFKFTAGLSLTYINYKESPLSVSVTGIFASVKGGAVYELIPKKWEIDASAYVNVAPIIVNVSPEGQPAPRFWGLNARMSYTLPVETPNFRLRAMAGPYLWGMMVSNNGYGIGSLFGAQIFLQGQFLKLDRPVAFMTLKYAPIGKSFSTISKLKNYEVAFGAGFRVFKINRRLPVFATLDLSYLNVPLIEDAFNQIKLTTVSSGLGISF